MLLKKGKMNKGQIVTIKSCDGTYHKDTIIDISDKGVLLESGLLLNGE